MKHHETGRARYFRNAALVPLKPKADDAASGYFREGVY